MRKLTTGCLAAGLIGLVAGQASAELSSADRNFATKSASGGLAEIQAAQIAKQKAESPQVKAFADRMISDHTQANNDLQQIAQQENLTLPTEPSKRYDGRGVRSRLCPGRGARSPAGRCPVPAGSEFRA